ncbi:MAG: DNA-directed RNA polymerase subunit omega [Firmicutes bacterium]|nr:DNA-directed RNA polymerase subunit omega [Bacillota bacterium]
MLHPSYMELIDHVNHVNEQMGEPKIDSRYTLVMAVAKRARDLVDGDELMVSDDQDGRPLSLAVKEMDKEKLGIVIEEPVYEEETEDEASEEEALTEAADAEEDADSAEDIEEDAFEDASADAEEIPLS